MLWIPLQAITIQPVSDHIVITVSSFDPVVVIDDMVGRLRRYNPSGPLKIMVDLRDNPGGYLHNALAFAAVFVTANVMVEVTRSQDVVAVTRPPEHPYVPTTALVILVNARTASAAEAAALVLAKHPNSVIIGEPTVGKRTIHRATNRPVDYDTFVMPQGRIIPHVPYTFTSHHDAYRIALRLAGGHRP